MNDLAIVGIVLVISSVALMLGHAVGYARAKSLHYTPVIDQSQRGTQ